MLKRQLYLYLIGMGEPHQIDVRLDGALLKRFTIGGEGKGLTAPESFAGNTQGDRDWEIYMHTADAGLEVRVPVKAGTRDVGVSFVRQLWEPEGVLQPPQRGFARTTNELYFGEPGVDTVLVGGPYKAVRATDTPSRRKIMVCRPAAATRASEEACATRILSTLARRAYRRPVTDAEVSTLLDFYRAGRAERRLRPGHPARASPHPVGAGVPVSRRARPVRLRSGRARGGSGVPDQRPRPGVTAVVLPLEQHPGRRAAEPGRAAARCRSRPCSSARSGGCCAIRGRRRSWTTSPTSGSSSGSLAGVVPDVDEFPDFDENLREALQQETRLFVASQLREDRSVVELVSANYTFVNERLARHYGIRDVYGSRFRRVTFDDGIRGGLLGQASILTATSYPNRTSPVLRGRWLLESLLGAPPPAPPPDVPALKENDARGRAAHRCASAWRRTAGTRAAPSVTCGWIRSASRSRTSTRSASGGR